MSRKLFETYPRMTGAITGIAIVMLVAAHFMFDARNAEASHLITIQSTDLVSDLRNKINNEITHPTIWTVGGTSTSTIRGNRATSTLSDDILARGGSFYGFLEMASFRATSTTATSTMANGLNLTGGCFALNGTCISSATINAGTANRLAYYSGGTTLDSANLLTFDATNLRLGVGTTSPGLPFSVHSEAVIGGTLTVSAIKATSSVSFPADSITDAMVSNTLTASDLVAASEVVADAEVVNTITLDNITQITTRPITSLTTTAGAGSIFFSDGTNPTTDTNLTFAATADRLTTLFASTTSISLSNLLNVGGTGTSTFTGGLSAAGLASSLGLRVSAGDTILAGGLAVTGSSNFTGNLGIGTSGPSHLLSVAGDIYVTRQVKGDWFGDTDGVTITFDCDQGKFHSVTLGGNRTIAFSNCDDTESLVLTLSQDGTGGRTVTWPAATAEGGSNQPHPRASSVNKFGILFEGGRGIIVASSTNYVP